MVTYWFDLGEGVVPLSVFIHNMYTTPKTERTSEKYDEFRLHMEQLLSSSITDFDIPMRIAIPLDNAGIRRITDLVSIGRNELLKINRLGEKSVNEIEKILDRFGLSLSMASYEKGCQL